MARPLAPLIDSEGRRGCINQLAEIEKHADAADVVASHEVLALVGSDWDFKVGKARGCRLACTSVWDHTGSLKELNHHK